MAKKSTGPSYDDVCKEVRAGNVRPVYLLMGEEDYYIQKLASFLVNALLPEEERDFGLITLYGPETNVETVSNAARAFPMGGERQVVLVREAQGLKNIAKLETYMRAPLPSTVLILCYMHGRLDRRLRLTAEIEKAGVVFESVKPYPERLPDFAISLAREKGLQMEIPAAQMLSEFIGADLSRLASEIEKLQTALPADQGIITADLVERSTGLSKEYTTFELCAALAQKDVLRTGRIVKVFAANPKMYPLQMILPTLFTFFADLMQAYYVSDRTAAGIAREMGKNEWSVKRNIMPALPNYTARKVMNILSALRRTDARSKGVGNAATPPEELLRELIFFILH